MENINKNLLEKFCGLLFSLKKSKKDFELVADEIGDSSLRTALNGLSADSNYYAGEIRQQLFSLGLNAVIPESSWENCGDMNFEYGSDEPGTELLNICTANENVLTQAYNEIITEQIPSQSLKEIMIFQLNALKYAFMKVRTLNNARFMSYSV